MIVFFESPSEIYALKTANSLDEKTIDKLTWLFKNAIYIKELSIKAKYFFIGTHRHIITPWSTNAVEIIQNMGIKGVERVELFKKVKNEATFDQMLEFKYQILDQNIFTLNTKPEAVKKIKNISKYNKSEGLALNEQEIIHLETLSKKIGRSLTNTEIFGFSQINSEHCRHKIFNGIFIIDQQRQKMSLFDMIRKTSKENPNSIVSAYNDNVAFIKGPTIEQFYPRRADRPDYYKIKKIDSVISLKAETHNFPTTVEPFNGAATGSGGEIRDRLAGGKGSIPLAGTAVYMTCYPRLNKNRYWEKDIETRKWLYHSPLEILIKASNGASDFGNKFGQPLIAGSVFTFEHIERKIKLGFDKVVMLAGGIGYGKQKESLKETPKQGDKIVILGGDNYRIGMGGAAVSSTDTGIHSNELELNAIQRSNPEMQKRVANTIRAMVELQDNPIVSIHDHGAGGHLNCLSELVEKTGGRIDLDKLPIGDPSLSVKEIIGNESQERMGLVIDRKNIETLRRIANRERSPMYTVGDVTLDHNLTFESYSTGDKPIDLKLDYLFSSLPKAIIKDQRVVCNYIDVNYNNTSISRYLKQVLQLEAVACKDWLTNKVDRSVTGLVAKQQCTGVLQLPLNNVGVMALDYKSENGVATAIGHSPVSGLIAPQAGSRNSIAEALTNIIWAPLDNGIKSVSLSANWMWPCKNKGEDARLYKAVKAVSDFAIELGINVPTGKDSLSMTQKYPDETVISPGTVIISAIGHCSNIRKVIEPTLKKQKDLGIYYVNMSYDNFNLGGSSFAQTQKKIGSKTPTIKNSLLFVKAFNLIQDLIKNDKISAGHDISSGGLITTLLEMCFSDINLGANIDLTGLKEIDSTKVLFSENSGIVIQASSKAIEKVISDTDVRIIHIGHANESGELSITNYNNQFNFNIEYYRDIWYKTSYLLDKEQSGEIKAKERFYNYKKQPLYFKFSKTHTGKRPIIDSSKPRIKAAIIREKGSNSDREMANAMYMSGFDVKDIHMTDLISGRETLKDIKFIATVGGFSNSDVLGSAKGWAGGFKYNEKANTSLKNFFNREDTLSLGVCNGCQLFVELGLIYPNHDEKPKMLQNDSKKFESIFTSVEIKENHSVMLHSLSGSTLGIWSAHGEGKFHLPKKESAYHIPATYTYKEYPFNPNGSDYNAAMLHSDCGRHLVMMPHLERSIFSWNWANYPNENDEVTPWLEAFINAYNWLKKY